MKIQMTVFSVDTQSTIQPVTLPDGTQAQAVVQGKRVQLVGAPHSTFALNLTGAQADAWDKPSGAAVTLTLE